MQPPEGKRTIRTGLRIVGMMVRGHMLGASPGEIGVASNWDRREENASYLLAGGGCYVPADRHNIDLQRLAQPEQPPLYREGFTENT